MKKALPIIIVILALVGIGTAVYYIYKNSKPNDQEIEIDAIDMSTIDKTNNVLIVLARSEFNDTEYKETRAELENAGFEVTVASNDVSIAHGIEGTEVYVDVNPWEIEVGNHDAIVFIGGSGAYEYFNDLVMQSHASRFYNSGKVVAAICSAPTILANAGILEGKSATCSPGYKDGLTEKGVIYTGETVTVDGNIVTGDGPEAAKEFAQAIIDLLETYKANP
jgi:protease I